MSLAREMGVCLHGALAVVGALGSGKVIVQEVFGRVSSMKEKWLPLPPLWEKTRDELVDGEMQGWWVLRLSLHAHQSQIHTDTHTTAHKHTHTRTHTHTHTHIHK